MVQTFQINRKEVNYCEKCSRGFDDLDTAKKHESQPINDSNIPEGTIFYYDGNDSIVYHLVLKRSKPRPSIVPSKNNTDEEHNQYYDIVQYTDKKKLADEDPSRHYPFTCDGEKRYTVNTLESFTQLDKDKIPKVKEKIIELSPQDIKSRVRKVLSQ
jgi:hypothetical protein